MDQTKRQIRVGLGVLTFWIILLSVLAGCREDEPIRLGFIGGTSGRVSEVGVTGRDAVIMAVEEQNAKGGISGRRLELLYRDDQQDPRIAQQHAKDLIDQKVVAIIGPMTSAMTVAIVPIADQHKTLVISPTATTNELSGKDDYFFRAIVATRYHAGKSARFQLRRGLRRFAIAYDTENLAYTKSWAQDFESAVQQGGGRILKRIPYSSSETTPFADLAGELAATNPDGIVLVCNAVDSAAFSQHIRKHSSHVALIFSEWSGTEKLVELGGRWVEGATVPQYINRHSNDPEYIAFNTRYYQRFQRKPGYAGVLAYNAANIILFALEKQMPEEELRKTLLRIKTFPGIQQPVTFDEFGDTRIETYITEIKNGAFMVVE